MDEQGFEPTHIPNPSPAIIPCWLHPRHLQVSGCGPISNLQLETGELQVIAITSLGGKSHCGRCNLGHYTPLKSLHSLNTTLHRLHPQILKVFTDLELATTQHILPAFSEVSARRAKE